MSYVTALEGMKAVGGANCASARIQYRSLPPPASTDADAGAGVIASTDATATTPAQTLAVLATATAPAAFAILAALAALAALAVTDLIARS
jgi:hypothetical protein